MSDHDALFQAILDSPDDDAPRLIYADWLDEHSDPERAEFIRLQCGIARLRFYEPRHAAADRRSEYLLARRRKKWRIPRLAARQEFRRGFVDEITLNANLFISRATELFRQAPIRRVGFTRLHNYHQSWDWHLVDRLEGLGFSGGSPPQRDGIHLPRLRWLKMSALWSCTRFLEEVACPRLEILELSGASSPPDALSDFLHHLDLTEASRLRSLVFDARSDQDYALRLRASGAQVLAEAGPVDLRKLHLRRQLVGDAGLGHLVGSTTFTKLEELYLDYNEIGLIGSTGIENLCSRSNMPCLRVLSLAGNPIGAPGLRELVGWSGLHRLRWLDLSDCGLSAPAARSLANSRYLHDRLTLRLGRNHFVPAQLFPAHVLGPVAPSLS